MTRLMDGLRFFTGKPAILAFFILCALPVGVLSALVTPPGQAPDEPKHMARALALLHGGILSERRPSVDWVATPPQATHMAGLKVDAGLLQASDAQITQIGSRSVVTTPDFLAIRAQPSDHRRILTPAPNTATYFPAAYVPAALGVALGLAVKAPPFACFLLARFFTLAAFLALGGLAIWTTAYGEALLLVVLIMPMSLFLAGSVSQDSVLIGLACLACAALTRGTLAARLCGLALFVLFLVGKPPYILMLGAFLLPLAAPGFWRRVRDVAIAAVPVLIWVVLITLFVVVPFGKQPYHPGPLYAGDRTVWMDQTNAAMNLHILLTPPSRLITLPWHTQQYLGRWMLQSMIGNLGLLHIPLGDAAYMAWEVAGVVAVLGLLLERRPVAYGWGTKCLHFLFISVLLLLTYWLLMIQFYLDWSNVGMDWIAGMQGRYFLPLLPFLLLAIPGFRWRFRLPPLLPALPAIALGIFDIGYIPMKLVWSFYLH